jgi:DNA helicase-2/ATP-dependent DNA helicase PcrA
MLEMVELLDKRPDVRSRWQYLYVTFDEAQDGCKTDWQLLKLLTEKHRNLMCVGDPGQNIYSFRGSDSGLFLNMDDMFPGTKKLFLATNYRSSPEVVALLKTIGPVPELATRFHTTNPSGPVPIVKGFLSPGDEAAWIVSEIKRSNNE